MSSRIICTEILTLLFLFSSDVVEMRVMLEKFEPWHVRTGVDIGYPQQIALVSSLVDPWS